MNGSFEPHPKNFGELLGQYETKRLTVPKFQRGYSWEKVHVAAFWEDLRSFHYAKDKANSPKKYFLGPIVILPEDDDQLVLDGQQRLATATILFSVIRDVARTEIGDQTGNDLARDIQRDLIVKDDTSKTYSLQLGDTDKNFFERTIQNDPPVNEKPSIRTHKLIEGAKQYLKDVVKAEIGRKKQTEAVKILKALKNTATTDMMMVAIFVKSEDDAYRIFETLNDRGLRLSVPDLLLNFLMRKASSDSEHTQIREKWTAMLELMGRRDISRFLRHMWLSKFGDVKARGLFREIKEHIETTNIQSIDFAQSCSEECDRYISLLELDNNIPKHAMYHVEGLVRYLAVEPALPLLLAGLGSLSSKYFEKLARLMVSLAMRHSVIANLNPSDLESAFYKAAREIRKQHSAGATDAKCLSEAKTILAKVNPDDVSVRKAIEGVNLTKDQAQYILATIANKLQSKTKEVGVRDVTVEHIFPKKPSSSWTNTADLQDYLWHIGNLTLLAKKLNAIAANKGFPEKAKNTYSKSEIEMTKRIAQNYTSWDPSTVVKRAKELGEDIVAIWKVA